VDAEPIENGIIEIQHGRIVAVHSTADPEAEDLGNVAIIPGLINAHTHLEFSDLAKPVEPPRPFSHWIRAVVEQRRNHTGPSAVDRGVQESCQSGTTTLGEIATSDWPRSGFPAHGLRTVLFRELLGLLPEQANEQLAIARTHLELNHGESNLIRGLSPHAPYSVHPDLFQQLVELANEFQAPLSVHLAETKAELELLSQGTGELVEMLADFGVWQQNIISPGTRPLDYLQLLEKLDHVLIVHGNYLSDDELDFLAEHPNMTVVYCPRTHHYFGHDEHPWQELLNRNINVAMGTDSLASNPNLSLWEELCFLRDRYPGVAPQTLLELGTLSGARALGLDDETGSLSMGKIADLAVVSSDNFRWGNDAYSQLFDQKQRITRTMHAGRWNQ
ncbi:MAG: amidohydrolase family protein, partial [Planctomycetes bacterium]|nr:amidohydrolase family protein [Planctomycetota bacterium]